MSLFGCYAVPTNQPVIERFRSQLANPSEHDHKFGVMVSTDVVRANSSVFETLSIVGAYESGADRVTLSKDTYKSMLRNDGSAERFAEREKTLERRISDLQARVLDLELTCASQVDEIAALKRKVYDLESTFDSPQTELKSLATEFSDAKVNDSAET